MKITKNNSKGITLIALIITIIVLLILAGISLRMLRGENGILTNAQKSKIEYSNSSEFEQVKLSSAEAIIEGNGNLLNKRTNNEKNGNLDKGLNNNIGENNYIYINENGEEINTVNEEGPWKIKINESENIYSIENNGKVTKEGKQEEGQASCTITFDKTEAETMQPYYTSIKATVALNEYTNVSECKYQVTDSKTPLGTDGSNYSNNIQSSESKIKLSVYSVEEDPTGGETYSGYVHILLVDNNGNSKEVISDEFKILYILH